MTVEHLAAVDSQGTGAAEPADDQIVGAAEGTAGTAAVEDRAAVDGQGAIRAGSKADGQNVVADGQGAAGHGHGSGAGKADDRLQS